MSVNVRVKVEEEGGNKPKTVAEGIGAIAKGAKGAVPALLLLNSTIGQTSDIFGKAIRSISGIASAFSAFGPGGAIVATVKAGMDIVAGYFIDRAEKMLAKAQELGAAMTKRLEKLKEARLQHLADDLERVADATAKAERRFEAAAAARAKLLGARNAAAAARDEGELSGMRHQMAADVAAVGDGDAARVGAAWQLKIAEREAQIRAEAADRERAAAEQTLAADALRLQLAEKNAQRLQDAANAAAKKWNDAFNTSSETDPQWVAQMKRLSDRATAAARAAWEEVAQRRDALAAAYGDEEAAELLRRNGVNAAYDRRDEAVWAYDRAERDHAAAQDEAERRRALDQEERDRLEMERRIAAERRRLEGQLDADRAAQGAAELRLAAAQAASARAWGWYRDKDSLRAQIDEEKANAAAERQFEKDFARLKGFRKDWRTADNLSLDDEAVRRVGLAREEEAEAMRYAAETAANTRRTAEAVERMAAQFESGGDD